MQYSNKYINTKWMNNFFYRLQVIVLQIVSVKYSS
jgi:hypothetical protein